MITNRVNTKIILERISFVAAIIALSFGFIVITGWVFNIGVLKSLHPNFVSMKANTAISFFFLGAGCLFIIYPTLTNAIFKKPERRYLLASLLSVVVGLVSAMTIIQYLLNVDLGIDEILFIDDTFEVATYSPGLMALHAAFGFLFLSTALLIYSLRKEFAFISAQLLSLLVLLLSVLPILGYLYRMEGLFEHGGYTQMALHTAILFFLTSLSLLLLKPDQGLLSIFSSTNTGSYFARRLLPVAILIPVVLIWLRVMIDTQSIPFSPFKLSYFFILLIIVFVWFIWRIALSLNKLDAENKQKEAEKQSWINLFEYVIKHDPNAIVVFDTKMHIIYVSDRFLSDYKVRDKNIIGKHHYDVFPEIPEKWREVHSRALQGEVLRSEEDYFEREDGTVDYTSWECRPWHKPDGGIGGMITYTEVITARKKAEQEIKDKNTFIQTVLDNLPIGVALSKFHEGEATYMNKKFIEIYGWDEENLKNIQDFLERVYPDPVYRKQITEMIMSDIQSGKPERMQWENIMTTAEDGSTRYINAYNIPLAEQNTMISTVIDVTKQKAYEQQVKSLNEELEQKIEQRTHELQQANKELEAFTYSVSHDLRAPLRAIDGFTRILQEDYDGILNDDGKRVTSVIRDNTLKMRQLIDDLLTFSRLSRKKTEHSEIDMGTLAHSIYYELTTERDRNKWYFNVENLPRAYGDPTMIRQVWVNLISNALKFSAPKEKPEISIFATNEGDYIKYSIKDNGVGFDMRYVDKIFGVFQRLHSVREFEGTGVGLAIVQRVIEKHEGMVSATSKLEEFALLNFSLPVQLK